MNRSDILDTAKQYVCKDRNASYGEPEDNFQNIANLWNSYLIAKCGVCIPKLEAVDVGIMMTLLKVARMASGNKEDNYIDAAGYIACAGEIATEEADRKLMADASKRVLDSLHEMANKDKKPENKQPQETQDLSYWMGLSACMKPQAKRKWTSFGTMF